MKKIILLVCSLSILITSCEFLCKKFNLNCGNKIDIHNLKITDPTANSLVNKFKAPNQLYDKMKASPNPDLTDHLEINTGLFKAYINSFNDNDTVHFRFIEYNGLLNIVVNVKKQFKLFTIDSEIPISENTFKIYQQAYMNGLYNKINVIKTSNPTNNNQTTSTSCTVALIKNMLDSPEYVNSHHINFNLAQIDDTIDISNESNIFLPIIQYILDNHNNSLSFVMYAVDNSNNVVINSAYDFNTICPPDNCPY